MDDNDTTVCLGDHYRDLPDQIYVDIPMDIDGSPPRLSEVTSTKKGVSAPFIRRSTIRPPAIGL